MNILFRDGLETGMCTHAHKIFNLKSSKNLTKAHNVFHKTQNHKLNC